MIDVIWEYDEHLHGWLELPDLGIVCHTWKVRQRTFSASVETPQGGHEASAFTSMREAQLWCERVLAEEGITRNETS